MTSKIHCRIVLDVFVVAESAIAVADKLQDCKFGIDASESPDLPEGMEIQDVTTVSATVTDSR